MITSHGYISTISPYVGGDASPTHMERRIVLASNENPLGPSPLALEAYENSLSILAHYPSGSALKLRTVLGSTHGIDPKNIICGNGSEELIHLLCRAYIGHGDEVIIPQYGFLVYSIATKSVGGTCVFFSQTDLKTRIEDILSKVTLRTKIVFIDNPANPLGGLLQEEEIRALRQGLREDILLVLDEAYGEYVEDIYKSGTKFFQNAKNVIVLRTFSKAYGLAGLRIGWGWGDVALLDPLHRIRPPFNVNAVGQRVAMAALHDQSWVEKTRNHTTIWRQWTKNALEHLGYNVPESFTNFLLLESHTADNAKNLYEFLGQHYGIIVRPLNGYGLPHILRVTIGLESEMKDFIHAMGAYHDNVLSP